MRLLILTQKVDKNDDNLGFFHRWVEEFARQCEQVTVICLFEGTHSLPSNVRVLSLGKESGVSRLKYLRRFYSYIWRERKNYDAVFVHMNQIYVVLGGLLWRLLGKRVGLWYAHGTVSWTLVKATILSHLVFTSTPEGFRVPTKKKRVVGQGIDAALFVQKRNYDIGSPMRLVTAGRITFAKDIEGMIDIVAALATREISATLDLIGSGERSYIGKLQAHAEERDVVGQISFLGGMPYGELAKTLASYDAFLNLGRTGSLDKALLDGGAAGLPIVTTNPAFKGFSIAADTVSALERLYRTKSDERRAEANAVRSWIEKEHLLSGLVARIVACYSRA
jgi:glycosyltransferase involved in cell wall biosynthesis